MKEIKSINGGAYGHLKGIKEVHWCWHAFSYVPKCDILLKNLCEVFNSKLVDARDKTLFTMLKMIRRYLMTRVVKNRDSLTNFKGLICISVQDKLNINNKRKESRDCKPLFDGRNRFEVQDLCMLQVGFNRHFTMATTLLHDIMLKSGVHQLVMHTFDAVDFVILCSPFDYLYIFRVLSETMKGYTWNPNIVY